MKKINIYFGKQQDTFLGSYADTVTLEMDDKDTDRLVKHITEYKQNGQEWFGMKTLKGIKYIHISKILWFEVDDGEVCKYDGIRADITAIDDIKGDKE